MATVNTEKILDMNSPVGFWVRSSQQSGMIEVGRNGEKLPFLFWIDPEPIPVKYFSFSSWGTVVCRWMFKCKPDLLSAKVMRGYTIITIPKYYLYVIKFSKKIVHIASNIDIA